MDLRVRKTYLALMDAFTSLMEERLYEDITIGALCERAMIRRTTFYKHFTDKDDFFKFYIRTLRDEFQFKSVSNQPDLTVADKLVSIIDDLALFVREHESLAENALKSRAMPDLAFSLGDAIVESVTVSLEEARHAAKGASAALDYSVTSASRIIAGGIVSGLLSWWGNGHTDDGLATFKSTVRAIYAV